MNTMAKPLLTLAALFLFSCCLGAQAGRLGKKHEREMALAEQQMAELITVLYTDSSETARFTACRDLIKTLVAALDRPNSFSYDFAPLPGLSIQYPQDRSFRLFTWELAVGPDEFRHYGALQRNEKKLALTPLVDRSDKWTDNPENRIVGADDWLGYLVYDLEAAGVHRGVPYYFLFGYDTYGSDQRRKILDVLSIDPATGALTFGLPVFDTYSDADLLLADRARIILQYGAGATTALRYDRELGGVVYENLVMVAAGEDGAPVSMPDGSYHFLHMTDDGRWREQEKIFDHIYEEAPRESGKPGGGLDLMGRPRKPAGGGRGLR